MTSISDSDHDGDPVNQQRDERVEELLDEFEECAEADKRAVIERLCADESPGVAAEFRRRAMRLAEMNGFLGNEQMGDVAAGESSEWRVGEAGQLPAGRFRPIGFHAQGGLGQVFTAVDVEIQRTVALKRMHPRRVAFPSDRTSFEQEARITGRLEHPGIVPVYGLGADSDGRPVYAMRLIRGGNLADAIAEYHGHEESTAQGERRVQLQQLLRRFLTVCQAVAYAHSQRIVHRDIKPANILLGEYGETLLVDWGLAKEMPPETEVGDEAQKSAMSAVSASDDSQAATQSQGENEQSTPALDDADLDTTVDRQRHDATEMGDVKGSPSFMSPEQAAGRIDLVGPASDIYGLGATLYAILTGRQPFAGKTTLEVLEHVRRGTFDSPRKLHPKTPRALEAVCLKAMSLDPADRYGSTLELAEDIERWLADEPVSAWPEPLGVRAARWVRRNRKLAASLLVSGLVVVGVVVASAWLLQAERWGRQEIERSEDAGAFAMLKEQIRAERFVEAERTLAAAEARLDREAVLTARRSAWRGLEQVVRFYRGSDSMWNSWGEENYAGVLASAEQTLSELDVLADDVWWEHLPTADLSPDEQDRFEQEVYRMLMIYGAAHTVGGSTIAEQAQGAAQDAFVKAKQAGQTDQQAGLIAKQAAAKARAVSAGLFQKALVPFGRSQAWEMKRDGSVSLTSRMMEQINRDALETLGAPRGDDFFLGEPQLIASDYYFLGLTAFVVARSSSGLLRASLERRLAGLPIPRSDDALETSERLLRIAAGSERRYWPNFALGRTLFFEKKYPEAELAFGACAMLRPDYARSYEQRAVMRAHQARLLGDTDSERAHREKLEELARQDSARALTLAHGARDSSTWWPKGDLHALLGEEAAALAAYAFALEWEDDIRQKVNRRNNLAAARSLAEAVNARDDAPPELRAEAHGMIALALLALDASADSRVAALDHAEQALALVANHPPALTARGLHSLRMAELDANARSKQLQEAVDDITAALASNPDNLLAAESRAKALEQIDRQAAHQAWAKILADFASPPADDPARWPLSDDQRARAERGLQRTSNSD